MDSLWLFVRRHLLLLLLRYSVFSEHGIKNVSDSVVKAFCFFCCIISRVPMVEWYANLSFLARVVPFWDKPGSLACIPDWHERQADVRVH